MNNPITTLSRERLEEIKENGVSSMGEDSEMARALLAVMDAKDGCPLVELYEDLTSSKPIRFAAIIALTKKGFSTKEAKDFLDAFMRDRDLTTPPAPSAPDGWVKCSSRMPEHNQQVLTWNGQYKATDLCLSGRFLCIKPDLVTHWMPLPAAPE